MAQETTLTLERFGKVKVIKPSNPKFFAVALFKDPKSAENQVLAKKALDLGGVVATININDYLSSKNWEGEACINAAGELERFSQVLQKNIMLEKELPAVLIADSYSSTLAMRVQIEAYDTFGLLILDQACDVSGYPKDLCLTDGFEKNELKRIKFTLDTSADLLISPNNKNKCEVPVIVDSDGDSISPTSSNEDFNLKFDDYINHLKPITDNIINTTTFKLPVTKLTPTKNKNIHATAIFFSGDGGWADIDRSIGEALQKSGYTILGFDSLRFFWQRKTLLESKDALHELIEIAKQHTDKPIILIGFSFGADVIPSIYNQLSEEDRKLIGDIILLSPSRDADLEIHLLDWLPNVDSEGPINVVDEVGRIQSSRVYCWYGREEQDTSLCTYPNQDKLRVKVYEGDHHFDGEYKKVSEDIINAISKNS